MKRISILLFVFLIGMLPAYAQLPDAYLRYLKAGNSLREANQFDQAEYYLKRGLEDARQRKATYWEAVAQEYLGLLYRDTSRNVEAIRAFNKSIELYNNINMGVSARAVRELSSGIRGVDEVYAGVDIGSKGVKLSLIGVSLNARGQYEYATKYDNTKNTDPMVLSSQSNAATLAAVQAYLNEAETKHGIPKDRIFVVVSSGLKQEVDKKNQQTTFETQIVTPIKNAGYKFDYITPEQEGQYLAKGIVPPRQLQTVSVLDVGSGNTKGGAFTGNDSFDPISFPFGTKSFTNEIKKYQYASPQEFGNMGKLLIDGRFKSEIADEVNRHPVLKNRPNVYLSGGIVWAIATYLKADKVNELFVELTPADIRKFKEMAINDYQSLTNPNLAGIEDDALFEKAKTEVGRVTSTFEQEALISGSIWLEALVNEWSASGPKKKLYFARQGVVGWLTGYIVYTVTEQYKKETE
ncbi:MAG: hypothetical protein JNN12_14460 [Bacteroidetes Order II. Incertae sedis bacterium]|nr:hypothetical protein [Bacteroidetes Order II. bacterium]